MHILFTSSTSGLQALPPAAAGEVSNHRLDVRGCRWLPGRWSLHGPLLSGGPDRDPKHVQACLALVFTNEFHNICSTCAFIQVDPVKILISSLYHWQPFIASLRIAHIKPHKSGLHFTQLGPKAPYFMVLMLIL